MDQDEVARAIRQLPGLTIAALSVKYRELFNQPPRLAHKAFLVRRIAWQLQAQTLGDLSDRSRGRIAEIADHSDIRRDARPGLLTPAGAPREPLVPSIGSTSKRDPRLPPAGSVLQRRHQGREIVVKVLTNGFEYESRNYSSLSAIARQVTGTRWNGLLFFRLTERRHG
jgi:Protein of unknown function (DUF2924)